MQIDSKMSSQDRYGVKMDPHKFTKNCNFTAIWHMANEYIRHKIE